MIEKAMILAAGFGKRMQPLTFESPKPLLKAGNETLLSNTLNFLQKSNIKKVVINVHYLGEQIIEYISKKNFNLDIEILNEKDKILNTGGGILNAINYFSEQPFLVINPDTIWSTEYLSEFKLLEKIFLEGKKKCALLVVKNKYSFDKSLKGDFNLKNNFLSRKDKNNLNYIYTGMQIIEPAVFNNLKPGAFSINKVWDKLIEKKQLFGVESNNSFLHATSLKVYNQLIKINFKH